MVLIDRTKHEIVHFMIYKHVWVKSLSFSVTLRITSLLEFFFSVLFLLLFMVTKSLMVTFFPSPPSSSHFLFNHSFVFFHHNSLICSHPLAYHFMNSWENLSIFQWNCHSISANGESSAALLLKYNPSIIFLNETWLKSHNRFSLRNCTILYVLIDRME